MTARSRLSAALGRPVAVKLLAEAASVAALAQQIAARAAAAPGSEPASSCLVQLQPGSRGTPMFFVHGGGGHALMYRELARAIDPDRAMYGFSARGLDTDEPPHGSVEAMASHYLELARAIQPEGPYLLVGASFGGSVVYEMARRLSADGHAVPLCAMLDAPGPGALPEVGADVADLLAFYLDGGGWLPADELRALPLDDQLQRVLDAGRAAGAPLPFTDLVQGRRLIAVWQNNFDLLKRYAAPAWPTGDIQFYAAADHDPRMPRHLERAWIGRCPVRVEIAPGNHWTMVGWPHAATLGARIRTYLETRTGRP
jgi:thioesterase domain-containing protein